MSRIYVDPENIRYVKAGNRYKKGGTKQMYTYDLQELKWFFKILIWVEGRMIVVLISTMCHLA